MKRSTFGSRFGTVMVVGGSVVGLGNIWRFPYVAGENGGAAFILIYILVSLLISIPIMLSEFSIGRLAQSNSMRAFRNLGAGKAWGGVGLLGTATALTILSFYSVIAGWSLEMLKQTVMGTYMDQGAEQISQNFSSFVATGWRPALWTLAFSATTAFIVSRGIEKGIERFNKVAMPLMIVILLVIAVYSFTLPGFADGASFVLRPDFSKVNPGTVLKAMGQSFFSLSLGMGVMITYGSYLKRKENMFRVAGTVAFSDLAIAILSGLAIFPAVFTFGISPTSGPVLVFETLPNIFAQMAGGRIIGTMFFILLFSAAITSSVSLLESGVALLSEESKFGRKKSTAIIAFCIFLMSLLCIRSQMPGSSLRVAGMNIFTLFDNATSLYMLPIAAFFVVIFAGWKLDKNLLQSEMTSGDTYGVRLFRIVRPLVKYAVPIFIALLFLSQLGFIK